MLLKNHSLRQIDEAYLRSLDHEDLIKLSTKLLDDLKEARERLGQNPSNSSRPPSSQAPWVVPDEKEVEEASDREKAPDDEDAPEPDEAQEEKPPEAGSRECAGAGAPAPRKAGKQPGAPGYGRTQRLAVTQTVHHRPGCCAVCAREAQEQTEYTAWTGYDTLDLEVGVGEALGLRVTNTRHLFYDMACVCGHQTRETPYRGPDDSLWESVALSEWRLVGETLCALIVALSYRARMSRARVQEFLRDWLGLELSLGTLQRCLEEAARAAVGVEDQLVEEVVNSGLLHADETPHKEHGKPLWLWVFTSATVVLFYVGYRSREMVENLLGKDFMGWLMSDGYGVYRAYAKRLRCWAHLLRKAKGLEESLMQEARGFGKETTTLLKTLMAAIDRAREGPGANLTVQYQARLEAFRTACEQAKNAHHEKTRALAVEFLNDWEAIFRVLAHPHLPVTNNEAERALRHWVMLRRTSYGTHTPVGSRALALLASLIDTCRKRQISPWPYLAGVIAQGRRGREVPPLPAAA